jgi:hypothetical protein
LESILSTDIYALPGRIRGYGQTAGTVGTAIASAGALDLGAHLAALSPVFGAIGTEFLGAFGAAHITHTVSIGELASHFDATALAAEAAAAGYESTDLATATAARSVQGRL